MPTESPMLPLLFVPYYETILKPAGLDESLLQGASAKIYESALVIIQPDREKRLALEKFRRTLWEECFPTIAMTFIFPFERRPDFEYRK